MRVTSRNISRAVSGTVVAMSSLLAACGDPITASAPELAARRITMSGVTTVVTNTSDAGAGSLRDALLSAGEGDLITFDPSLSGETINVVENLYATVSAVVEGPAGGITIKAPNASAGLLLYGGIGTELIVKRLTFTGGAISGVVLNGGTLQLEDCVVEGNTATKGGGINVFLGDLKLIRTIVRNNTASGDGGGISVAYGATASITNSTISGNVSAASGGGIYAGGEVTIVASTVSENTATIYGGGVFGEDDVVLRNSTFSGNNAPAGSNIFNGVQLTIEHSTIVGNSSGSSLQLESSTIMRNSILSSAAANCGLGTSIFMEGANVISDNSCPLGGPAAPIIADAKLAPLALDGVTAVHHLLTGSPAINAAPACLVNVDQRGSARPLGGACDLGSIEEPVPLLVTPTTAASATINSKTGVVLLNGKVSCSVDGAVSFTATLEQTQKSGKVNFVLKASAPVQATCANGTALWSAFAIPSSGAFTNGAARVTLAVGAAGGVTPFSSTTAIKLTWTK